jgi:hypothetical protein
MFMVPMRQFLDNRNYLNILESRAILYSLVASKCNKQTVRRLVPNQILLPQQTISLLISILLPTCRLLGTDLANERAGHSNSQQDSKSSGISVPLSTSSNWQKRAARVAGTKNHLK